MPDIFAGLEQELGHLLHAHRHAAPETPAEQPVNLAPAPAAATAPQKDTTMSLTTIAADIKGAIENADQWVSQVTETHLPAILAQAAKYENSPIVQALENAFLPPALEQQIAGMITELAKSYPAATPQPEQPQQPVPAGQ